MKLQTKSIQSKKSNSDGIRICVMRRIRPEFKFDVWVPNLAPPAKLLKAYHDKEISWEKFEKRFAREVLESKKEHVEILAELTKKHDVTILCWEKKGENCHRLLIAEKIKQLYPDIPIKHL
ncbi:MAG: DUF488 family protein [Candidatus Levyibacteriota bacterium]|jgi:uncharacterized protein YeaO (DUF488 family)